MEKIVYIGNSQVVVHLLQASKDFKLEGIVSEIGKCDWDNVDKNETDIYYVENKFDIFPVLKSINIPTVIMYNFGIIIPKKVVEKFNIFNFHSGDLRINRGSSPVNWSILLGHTNTKMSLYKISEEIDLGWLISERLVKIEEYDTPESLKKRMELQIPYMLSDLRKFLNGEIMSVPLQNGIYRKRITEEDYTIDQKTDSLDVIKNKIRSQQGYKGAILISNGVKYFVKSLDEYLQIIGEHVCEK